MCRFIAFVGEKPILLKETAASLISQSHHARESSECFNADGFGIGWYDLTVDSTPAVFKSIRPAWNDENLINICAKVRSKCCMGHVRASTVGEVNRSNCHPFSYKNYLFVHNGTIHSFKKIRRELLSRLGPETFEAVKGQTDSEHFFLLICEMLEKREDKQLTHAICDALEELNAIYAACGIEPHYRINAAIADGTKIVAMRYTTETHREALSLYYAAEGALYVSSETQKELSDTWHKIPANHLLLINDHYEVSLESI